MIHFPLGSYWLGNEIVHKISAKRKQKIKIILKSFNGNVKEWIYNQFKIESETKNYTLRASQRVVPSDDILGSAKAMQFSSLEYDNDASGYRCARQYNRGGFWYKDCGRFRPNARWVDEADSRPGDSRGIRYVDWIAGQTLKSTEMMIRDS